MTLQELIDKLAKWPPETKVEGIVCTSEGAIVLVHLERQAAPIVKAVKLMVGAI